MNYRRYEYTQIYDNTHLNFQGYVSAAGSFVSGQAMRPDGALNIPAAASPIAYHGLLSTLHNVLGALEHESRKSTL